VLYYHATALPFSWFYRTSEPDKIRNEEIRKELEIFSRV
jgi:hypothetical protein